MGLGTAVRLEGSGMGGLQRGCEGFRPKNKSETWRGALKGSPLHQSDPGPQTALLQPSLLSQERSLPGSWDGDVWGQPGQLFPQGASN